MGRLETEKVLTCEVETMVSNKKGRTGRIGLRKGEVEGAGSSLLVV